MIYIETERLILRDWLPEDVSYFQQMNVDPEVRRYFPDIMSYKMSENVIKRMQEEIDRTGLGLFAVAQKSDGSFIGFIGVQLLENYPLLDLDIMPCYEIGWRLMKDAWNKGYATEGATAVLDYTRMKSNLSIYSFTSKLNLPSIRVMEKIGLVKIGEFEHAKRIKKGDPLRTHVLYKDVRQ